MLKDLNSGDKMLAIKVLEIMGELMDSDYQTCIKILKMKIISNLLTHFVLTKENSEVDEDGNKTIEVVNRIIKISINCKFSKELIRNSEQFKDEKERLGKIAVKLNNSKVGK